MAWWIVRYCRQESDRLKSIRSWERRPLDTIDTLKQLGIGTKHSLSNHLPLCLHYSLFHLSPDLSSPLSIRYFSRNTSVKPVAFLSSLNLSFNLSVNSASFFLTISRFPLPCSWVSVHESSLYLSFIPSKQYICRFQSSIISIGHT